MAKKKSESKNKGGRPKKHIDLKKVYELAKVAATQEEIADELGLSVRTLQRSDEFCREYKKGLSKAKISLRRKQFLLADNNATMAIWLGKTLLKQKEVKEVKFASGDKEAKEFIENLTANED